MLDKVSPEVRHFVIGLLAAVLAVASQWIPQLGLHPALAAIVGAGVGYALLYLTPLVKQYGIGSKAPVSKGDQ